MAADVSFLRQDCRGEWSTAPTVSGFGRPRGRSAAGYVIETFNCWDFCTNWAPGSEELMFTVK
jgi:hypothetical protein